MRAIFFITSSLLLFLNGCAMGTYMGTYKRVASECSTKSVVYKSDIKKDCFCPKEQKQCPCSENSDGYTLHAYSRED